MTTSPNDPDQIRRDIERTQAGLSRDVDLLTEKVTPGKIVERRVNRVRSTANRWRDNVMGSDAPGPAYAGRAQDTASRVGDTVSGTASSAASTVSDAASSTVEAVQEVPQFARRQAQGNPIAAGLIAFGAGWLVSSLIPASNREQRLAEEARQRATELGKPLAEQAKQVANEVRENLAPQAQQAVESVRSTATEAGQTITDESRVAAEHVQGRTQDAAGNVRENSSSS